MLSLFAIPCWWQFTKVSLESLKSLFKSTLPHSLIHKIKYTSRQTLPYQLESTKLAAMCATWLLKSNVFTDVLVISNSKLTKLFTNFESISSTTERLYNNKYRQFWSLCLFVFFFKSGPEVTRSWTDSSNRRLVWKCLISNCNV